MKQRLRDTLLRERTGVKFSPPMLGESQLAGKADSRAPALSSGLLGYLQSRTHSAPSYNDAFSPLSYALHMSNQAVCLLLDPFLYLYSASSTVTLWANYPGFLFCLFVLMAR